MASSLKDSWPFYTQRPCINHFFGAVAALEPQVFSYRTRQCASPVHITWFRIWIFMISVFYMSVKLLDLLAPSIIMLIHLYASFIQFFMWAYVGEISRGDTAIHKNATINTNACFSASLKCFLIKFEFQNPVSVSQGKK